jgi:hypothetical protein
MQDGFHHGSQLIVDSLNTLTTLVKIDLAISEEKLFVKVHEGMCHMMTKKTIHDS